MESEEQLLAIPIRVGWEELGGNMGKPIIADLFCGGGGAAKGLNDAGFDVVGFDIVKRPNYPYSFVQQDAFTVKLDAFDAIWASPMCQRFCNLNLGSSGNAEGKVDQLEDIRHLLVESGKPFIIENGPNAPLLNPLLLCGTMFDPLMNIRRHRGFESNVPLNPPDWACRHKLHGPRYPYKHHGKIRKSRVVWVFGNNHMANEGPLREAAMEIDWMSSKELTQAVPPRYAEFLGRQLRESL